MENQNLLDFVSNKFPFADVKMGKQFVEINIDAKDIFETAKTLKENPETKFDYLFCESAVDFLSHFMLVYHLDSSFFRHTVVIRAKISDRDNASIDSVYSLWKTAEYHEREIFDLFGITFNNHPDLRKIFLDSDWVGFPLRKDYKDDVNIVER